MSAPVIAKPREAPVPIIAPPYSRKIYDEVRTIYEQTAPAGDIPKNESRLMDKIRIITDIISEVSSRCVICSLFFSFLAVIPAAAKKYAPPKAVTASAIRKKTCCISNSEVIVTIIPVAAVAKTEITG